MDELLGAGAIIAVLTLIGTVGGLMFRKDFDVKWFAVAVLLYLPYDYLLTMGFFQFSDLGISSNWNWIGKLLSLGGMVAVAASPRFGFARCGLTLRQKPESLPAYFLLGVLCLIFLALAITDGSGPDKLETIAFQWTMPGLDEEVFYRGVLLLAMNEAFRTRWRIFGTPIGIGGLLTSIAFGLAHALSFENGGYAFDLMTFFVTGIPSLLLLWMRERTGSILLPIIGHNFANGISTII
jgi:membrane protease YdiL (CAAX protease family)